MHLHAEKSCKSHAQCDQLSTVGRLQRETDVQRPKPRTTVVHCASCFLSVSKLQLALSIAKAAYTRSLGTHTLAAVFSVIKCCLIISIDNANRDLSSTPVVPIRNDAQMRLPPFMDASIHPFGQRIVHKVGRRCVVFGFFLCFFGQNNIRPHQPLTDLGRHTRQAAALALMIHRSAFVRSVRYMSSLV